MPTLNGTTHASNGDPATEVVAFVWSMRGYPGWGNEGLPYRAFPNSAGVWTLTVPQDIYGLVFFFANCPPVVHGPYEPKP